MSKQSEEFFEEDNNNNCSWCKFISGTKFNSDGTPNLGNVSDGYHTFDELYEHRTVLFAALCCAAQKSNSNCSAWISYKHSDGTSYPGMFIAGISTFWGDATYHIEGKYLPLFASIPMREKAPEYDGHTPEEALDRIFRCFCSDLHEDMIKGLL